MIARCRAKCWVVHLKEENQGLQLPYSQRGFKGHIIIYPQNPSALLDVLPCTLDDVSTPVCVIFVGSKPPSAEWLRTKARPLIIRRERVRNALQWLVQHNPLYAEVVIDHTLLDSLQEEQTLPVHIQHVLSDQSDDLLTSKYDVPSLDSEGMVDHCDATDIPVPFSNVVVTDRGGGYIEVPHGPQPVNEFFNPQLFPMIYPILFPYGLGGFEDSIRTTRISMKKHTNIFKSIIRSCSPFSMYCNDEKFFCIQA
ncbi:uncharacterized protein F5891DRAFT_1132049 [Suillus fuscotomentosus]|uniref:DUF6570 domain-containing protein n=1 Tax=Suillus fuscotomentosus TaxID=1912939 RepID=A0AAD4DPD2_9AGAM|nr:uncharacterized protein F5891DRAFT_1132049 [Suillus fuscotomentosus]KAG1887960.1 hypothetical protein F5891DRAFT_1132049 [Suillus fuscotomentosus]